MNNEIFHVVPKSRAGADEKHDINFYWPYFNIDIYTLDNLVG